MPNNLPIVTNTSDCQAIEHLARPDLGVDVRKGFTQLDCHENFDFSEKNYSTKSFVPTGQSYEQLSKPLDAFVPFPNHFTPERTLTSIFRAHLRY